MKNSNYRKCIKNAVRGVDDFLFSVAMQDEKICRTVLEILLETEISEIKYILGSLAAELKSLYERVKIIAFAISEDYRFAASENYASRKLFFHFYENILRTCHRQFQVAKQL